MNRRKFLQHAGTASVRLAFSNMSAYAKTASRKPNFVLVLADDMGFSDAGCFGGEIVTPTIDGLAKNGTRFTQMYSTARCGPSRNCLLTGRYAQQTAADVMTKGNIPEYMHFLPQYLRRQGYRSYHSGKWHMRLVPRADGVGFDRSYTMLDENRFFTQERHLLDDVELPRPGEGYYSTTAIADRAVEFLTDHQQNHSQDPFFLFLAFHAPHFPLQAPQQDIDLYRGRFDDGWDAMREHRIKRLHELGIVNCGLAALEPDVYPSWNVKEQELQQRIGPGEVARAVSWNTLTDEQKRFQSMKMSIHAAMITRMDAEIAKVTRQLRTMDAYDDTVIVFLSDNGASAEEMIRGDGHDRSASPGSAKTFLSIGPGWATAADTPFRLHKSWVHEGGIASPMVVHWPRGITNGGTLRTDPCHFIDVLPTFVDLSGGTTNIAPTGPVLPGLSLSEAIRSAKKTPRDFIYFNHSNNRALRKGDWKIVAKGLDGPWELYDMSTDRSEQHNLATIHPEVLQSIAAQWKIVDELYVKQRESAPPTKAKLMPEAKAAHLHTPIGATVVAIATT
jgi:arylsulfatase A-like enzyme